MMSKQAILFSFFIFVAQNAGAAKALFEKEFLFVHSNKTGLARVDAHAQGFKNTLTVYYDGGIIIERFVHKTYEGGNTDFNFVEMSAREERDMEELLLPHLEDRICKDRLFFLYSLISSFLPEKEKSWAVNSFVQNDFWCHDLKKRREKECRDKEIALIESLVGENKEKQEFLKRQLKKRDAWKGKNCEVKRRMNRCR